MQHQIRKKLAVLALIAGCMGSSAAIAGSNCDDIDWNPKMLTGFAGMEQACKGVVERDGVRYIHFEVRLKEVLGNGKVKVLMSLQDGSSVERVFHAPTDFQVSSRSGKTSFHMDELARGDILDVYIAESRVIGQRVASR